MKLSTITCALLGLASEVAATALTYKLVANEKACFFATTKKANEKIAFYFAVRLPQIRDIPSNMHATVMRRDRCANLGCAGTIRRLV